MNDSTIRNFVEAYGKDELKKLPGPVAGLRYHNHCVAQGREPVDRDDFYALMAESGVEFAR